MASILLLPGKFLFRLIISGIMDLIHCKRKPTTFGLIRIIRRPDCCMSGSLNRAVGLKCNQQGTLTDGNTRVLRWITLLVISLASSIAIVSSQLPATGFLVRVIMSGILLSASLFIILSKKYSAGVVRWAYSIITLLVGYWLRS